MKRYFNTLSLAFQSCMGIAFVPAVRHFFSHVNMAFLAPLSWMLVSYITIYMTTRRSKACIHCASKRRPLQVHRPVSTSYHYDAKKKPFKTSKARNRHCKKLNRFHHHPMPSAPPYSSMKPGSVKFFPKNSNSVLDSLPKIWHFQKYHKKNNHGSPQSRLSQILSAILSLR